MVPFLYVPNFLQACSYRCPMLVRKLMIFSHREGEYGYYVCPQCQITVEREFIKYFDRCGQHLDWSRYEQAKIIYPGLKPRGAKATRLSPMDKLQLKFRFIVSR